MSAEATRATAPEPDAARPSGRAAWAVLLALTVGLTAITSWQAVERYHALRTGWSWDLAYYNQWYWALLFGDARLSVRPISAYANEGPEVWKTNYLSPLRYALIPVYRLAPGPVTLLVAHNVVFWWLVPAAFVHARGESRSNAVGLAAATLVPLTPLLWPLAWNDFREIQMALPFMVLGVEGVRARHRGVAAAGILGMLACRQEMAVVVGSLALLPAREPEDVGRTFRWAHALVVVGLVWLLFGFFLHLKLTMGASVPIAYINQFRGPGAPLRQTLPTLTNFLLIGLGAWVLFLPLAPRVALLMLPWLWSLASGRWSLRYLSTDEWHHVRYAAPFVGMGVAAGVAGFARFGRRVLNRPGGGRGLLAAWVAAAALFTVPLTEVLGRIDRQNHPIGEAEARAFWEAVGQVGDGEAVLAVYDVTAPLSSRRELYSYILEINRPKGYPVLKPEITWVFHRNTDGSVEKFESQGFRAVYWGPHLTILRRDGPGRGAGSK